MDLITNGLLLMVVGVGFVFLFLGIMITVVSFVSGIAKKYAHILPETIPVKKVPKPAVAHATTHSTGEDQELLVAVISAAIKKHRSR